MTDVRDDDAPVVLTEREFLDDLGKALDASRKRPVRVDVNGGRARVWIVSQTEGLDL